MRVRLPLLLLCLVAALPLTAVAQNRTPLPPGLKKAKPHEVMERILDKKADLALTEDQVARLTDWHERVADEPHRFKHDPTRKPHDVTHVAMVGRQEAFDSSVAILSEAQREQLGILFGTIPPGLSVRKPHEIVEQVLNRRTDLALSEDQIARLTDWHERIADEPHRFKHDPTRKPHDVVHVPMIGRQEAFDSAVAILNPTQRTQLATLFAKRP